MTWESIGSVNTGEMPDDESWILWSLRLAKNYVLLVCGEPPPGCKLDVMWHEHDYGSYPSLGVWSEFCYIDDYIGRCERALEVFDDAMSWEQLKEHYEDELFPESEDDEIEDEEEDS